MKGEGREGEGEGAVLDPREGLMPSFSVQRKTVFINRLGFALLTSHNGKRESGHRKREEKRCSP